MGKTMLYRLFGLGRFSPTLQAEIEAEGIIVQDEGIGGWLVERNLRMPGRRTLYKVRSFTGGLALTRRRFIVQTYRTLQVNLPLDDPRLVDLHVTAPHVARLTLAYDLHIFKPEYRGAIELRLNTTQATRFYEELARLGAQAGGNGLAVQRGLR